MKKGLVRMIVGTIMIGFQILSMLGSIKAGIPLPSFFNFYGSFELQLYNLVYFLSYYSIGILGVILFTSGIYAYYE